MKILRILPLAILLFAFTNPAADVQLKYQFKVGDQYLWLQKLKQSTKQNIGGTEQKTEMTFDSEFTLKVLEITSTGAKLESRFTKLKSDTKSPLANATMDSESKDDKTENKIFKSMVDKPFYVFLSRSGNVEKVEGTENLWSDLGQSGLDDQKQKLIKESLKMFLGDEALKSSFQSAFVPYPDTKVKVGDKWTTSNSYIVNFAMQVQNIWNVEAVTSSEVKLSGDGKYTTTDKDKVLTLPGGFKAKADLQGTQAVKSTVNPATGWPTNQELKMELKGNMTLLAGSIVPQDMLIPMETLSETTYVITKK